jgi:hypothetical protein
MPPADITMAAGTKNRRVIEKEQDLLDFARCYLSEGFPNPDRKGCPPDDAVRNFVNQPTETDQSISDHFTCCSPCFKAYMAHLAHARDEAVGSQRVRRATWTRRSLLTASSVILMIAIYALFIRRHNEPKVAPRTPAPIGKPAAPVQVPATAMNVPVLLDLSNVSPVRGAHEGEAGPSPQVIPSTPLIDLNLLLPLGSEERLYSVSLSSNRHVVWSGSAKALLDNGQTSLRIHADFSHVVTGNYDLVVVAKGLRLIVPVRVKRASRENPR